MDEAVQLESRWKGANNSCRAWRGDWLQVFENVPNREECSEAYESKRFFQIYFRAKCPS
jgi:hypothetical protein